MEYAADALHIDEGWAVREHAISAPGGGALQMATAEADTVYLAQQQNVMAAPHLASVVPPMGMVMANPVAVVTSHPSTGMVSPNQDPYEMPTPKH
jgi:hypothetical protein